MKIAFLEYSLLYESLGFANLMGVLKANDYDFKLFVISEEKDLIKSLKDYKPDLICLTACTGPHPMSFKIAQFIKKNMKSIILLGGPHPTIFPEECIKEDCIDMICRGEGEDAFLELVQSLEQKKDYTKIQNLWIKKEGKVYRNEIRPLRQDLDSLPFPDKSEYFKYEIIRDLPLKRFITGYGCPYACSFCHNPIFVQLYKGKYMRKKSVEKVINEIEMIRRVCPPFRIHFHDDHFNFNKEWLKEFCKRFREQVWLPWSCTVRVDILDEKTVEMMADAGCVGITTGLETHDEGYRNKILNKFLKNKDFEKAGELCKIYGIRHTTSIMLNLPGEDTEDIIKTIKFCRKIGISHIRASVYSVMAKQAIVPWLISNGYMETEPEIDNFKEKDISDITIQSREKDQIIRMSTFINIMFKYPFTIPIVKFLCKFPIDKFGRGRLYDGYLESKFMGLSLWQAIKYYLRVNKGMKAYQGLR